VCLSVVSLSVGSPHSLFLYLSVSLSVAEGSDARLFAASKVLLPLVVAVAVVVAAVVLQVPQRAHACPVPANLPPSQRASRTVQHAAASTHTHARTHRLLPCVRGGPDTLPIRRSVCAGSRQPPRLAACAPRRRTAMFGACASADHTVSDLVIADVSACMGISDESVAVVGSMCDLVQWQEGIHAAGPPLGARRPLRHGCVCDGTTSRRTKSSHAYVRSLGRLPPWRRAYCVPLPTPQSPCGAALTRPCWSASWRATRCWRPRRRSQLPAVLPWPWTLRRPGQQARSSSRVAARSAPH
jgi:hypothetical protein